MLREELQAAQRNCTMPSADSAPDLDAMLAPITTPARRQSKRAKKRPPAPDDGWEQPAGKKRKSKGKSKGKARACCIDNCERTFISKRTLKRHQTDVHGDCISVTICK